MQPLSIIAAMGFLGLMSVVGALMTVMSSRRMLRAVGSPIGRHRVQVMLTGNALLLTVGLAVLALGIRGIYRLIWVA